MNIKNKTNRPLRITLPGGKQLHLGPRKTGQLAASAAESAAVKKLVAAGEIELADENDFFADDRPGARPEGGGERSGHGGGAGPRRSSGDR